MLTFLVFSCPPLTSAQMTNIYRFAAMCMAVTWAPGKQRRLQSPYKKVSQGVEKTEA